MNRQEVFDMVVAHARAQGKQARNQNKDITQGGGCRYRADDGSKCFVGCLIKDEAYTPNLEGCIADSDRVLTALSSSGIDVLPGGISFMSRLQTIHDTSQPLDWEREFKYFADEYRLTYTPPVTP